MATNTQSKQRNANPHPKANYNALHHTEIEKHKKIFTNRLKKAREAKGYTQEEIAKKLDIELPTYRKYEQGESRRDIPFYLYSLATTLDISADYLLGLSKSKSPNYNAVTKKTGLNDKAIRQLIELHLQDGAENNPGYLDFINCFLGNEDCTALFFEGLTPILHNLYDAMYETPSSKNTTLLSQALSDYIYNYIVKVVVPTYGELYNTGTYTSVSPKMYVTDNAGKK